VDLTTRVEQLEGETRRARRLAVAAIGVSVLSVVMAQTQTSKGEGPVVVEAERFVVKDTGGATRATFGMVNDTPALGIMSDGKVVAIMTVGPDGGLVQTSGPLGSAALVMSPKGGMVALDGASERTVVTTEGVSLHGAGGKRLDAAWNRKGVILFDDQQQQSVQIVSRGPNTGLALFAAGKMQTALVMDGGKPKLVMVDAAGKLVPR
jgi:hypothetical protein